MKFWISSVMEGSVKYKERVKAQTAEYVTNQVRGLLCSEGNK